MSLEIFGGLRRPIHIFNKKEVALQSCHKTMHPFLDVGSNPDSAFIILCIIFSHYVLTNCSIYISYVIRSCCECYYLAAFHISHFLPLFVKLPTFIVLWPTFLVGFELTTRDDLLSVDSDTVPLSHGRPRTCIVIWIFIFKFTLNFLNSEHNSM